MFNKPKEVFPLFLIVCSKDFILPPISSSRMPAHSS